MAADPGYDDKKLYEYNKKVLGIDLLYPVKRYENTSKRDLILYVLSIDIRTDYYLQPEKDIKKR